MLFQCTIDEELTCEKKSQRPSASPMAHDGRYAP